MSWKKWLTSDHDLQGNVLVIGRMLGWAQKSCSDWVVVAAGDLDWRLDGRIERERCIYKNKQNDGFLECVSIFCMRTIDAGIYLCGRSARLREVSVNTLALEEVLWRNLCFFSSAIILSRKACPIMRHSVSQLSVLWSKTFHSLIIWMFQCFPSCG